MMTRRRSQWRIFFARLRGLPVGLGRRIKRASQRFIATFSNFALVKLFFLRLIGAHPSFLVYDANKPPNIGECIYCGRSGPDINLTREHALAYSLGGNKVLRDAVCDDCKNKTHEIEEYCTEKIFLDIRVHRGVHSRSPPRDELPIKETFAPDPAAAPDVLVPTKDHPGVLFLLSFGPPGLFLGKDRLAPFTGEIFFSYVTDDTQERVERLKQAGLGGVWQYREINVWLYGRLLAKTAHATAIVFLGIDQFKPTLQNLILNGGDELPYYVGCVKDVTPSGIPRYDVNVALRKIGSQMFVVVFFKLFSYLNTPAYAVVVGEFIPWWKRWKLRLCKAVRRYKTDKTRAPAR
jgi:hypothetical protein